MSEKYRPVEPEWHQLTEWIQNNTEKNALLLMPPYPYAIASTRRSNLIDYAYMGSSIYSFSMTSNEIDRIRSVFALNLKDLRFDDIFPFLMKNKGILCLLERRYERLVTSKSMLKSLQNEYPDMQYAIAFKEGILPYEWTCGPIQREPIRSGIVFSNRKYIVYEISKM